MFGVGIGAAERRIGMMQPMCLFPGLDTERQRQVLARRPPSPSSISIPVPLKGAMLDGMVQLHLKGEMKGQQGNARTPEEWGGPERQPKPGRKFGTAGESLEPDQTAHVLDSIAAADLTTQSLELDGKPVTRTSAQCVWTRQRRADTSQKRVLS